MVVRAPVSSCHIDHSIAVSVEPGATTLQRIPYSASSRPRHLVNIVAAALDAEYEAMPIRGEPAAFEATVTIAPLRRGTIRLPTALEIRKTPWPLTAKVVDHSSTDSVRAEPS